MNFKKLLSAAAVSSAFLAASASAAPVTVAGITWDPNSSVDFIAQSNIWEQVALTAGQTIQGYGQVTAMNGVWSSPGRELTYVFSGFELQNTITGAPNEDFAFKGGILNVYASVNNFSFTDSSTASDGVLFLSLQARAGVFNNPAFSVADANTTLYGETSFLSTVGLGVAGAGAGYFDVIGGAAASHFDTNEEIGGTDFSFGSNFSPLNNAVTTGGVTYTHGGGGTLSGNSIPEPGVLALIGLGFAGMGFARRNKKSAS